MHYKKMGFDLNEGFNPNQEKSGQPRTAVHLHCPLSPYISLVFNDLSASITIAPVTIAPFIKQ